MSQRIDMCHQEDDAASMLQWYLYMIRCREGTLYTGIATDVARRFAEHQDNSHRSAKYLRGKGPLTLVFEKALGTNRRVALSVERQIKNLRKSRKEAMCTQTDIFDVVVERARCLVDKTVSRRAERR